jgi:hypothetical protein
MISAFDFVYASPTESPAIRRATICNGSPDLCTRSFGNVTFVGAHDSYAVGTNNGELHPPCACRHSLSYFSSQVFATQDYNSEHNLLSEPAFA